MIQNYDKHTDSGWKQNTDFWNSTSLSPNMSYRFWAKARNGDGAEATWSPSANKITLANAPGPLPFSNVTQSPYSVLTGRLMETHLFRRVSPSPLAGKPNICVKILLQERILALDHKYILGQLWFGCRKTLRFQSQD